MPYNIQTCSIETYTAACKTVTDVLSEPVSFLQAPFYGNLQATSGKDVIYFTISRLDEVVGCGLGVIYGAAGGLNFLYCPYGPICRTLDKEIIGDLDTFFRTVAAKHNLTFVRLDSDEVKSISIKKPIPSKLACTASLQPRAEWVLDITGSKEALWMGFHKHARYNVRLAERANASTKTYKPSEAPLETFFSLMQATAERDGFAIFDKSYYASYLKTLTDEEGFVVIITIDGKPAAAGLFVLYDAQAHYVFGGSSNDFRKIAPAYMVIWVALQEAVKHGCTLFNFGGVTDNVKSQGLGGVTGFKKRFGGQLVEHANPIDFVYKPWKYFLFKMYKILH
ncbi:peptidoglycan bridge formation glycyltransferase FemA/FemB family protein [Candidatus Saccharibacteria bacterium]|nr:MAG: peptidoglycan bridge formation glycyltransferase FemA/FemB family protein [Candidatus Saccharibacteria bacterium]